VSDLGRSKERIREDNVVERREVVLVAIEVGWDGQCHILA
jgi:hypothetical protein